MLARFVITWVGLTLCLGCAKREQPTPTLAPVVVEKARPNQPSPGAERKADALSANSGETVPSAPPLPVPLAKGKRIRITRLYTVAKFFLAPN